MGFPQLQMNGSSQNNYRLRTGSVFPVELILRKGIDTCLRGSISSSLAPGLCEKAGETKADLQVGPEPDLPRTHKPPPSGAASLPRDLAQRLGPLMAALPPVKRTS